MLAHVSLDAVHDATQDADRDILLRLQWHDVVAVALAGRFLTVTQAPPDGASRPTARALPQTRARRALCDACRNAAVLTLCSANCVSLLLFPPGRCTCSSSRQP